MLNHCAVLHLTYLIDVCIVILAPHHITSHHIADALARSHVYLSKQPVVIELHVTNRLRLVFVQ